MGQVVIKQDRSSTSIFLVVTAILLSLTWLFPNHLLPWSTFFQETYISVFLIFLAFWVLWVSPKKLNISSITLFALLVSVIPWIQFAFGVIHSFGTAWMSSLFLFGFACSIALGELWEEKLPDQCLTLLFLAIAIAAFCSVGLQLLQWLNVQEAGAWVFRTETSRFSGNVGQPNLLGSLLLLGCTAIAWAYFKKAVTATVAVFAVLFLLTGVTLTESRTALLNEIVVAILLTLFWKKENRIVFSISIVFFLIYQFVFSVSLPAINEYLGNQVLAPRGATDSVRLKMWSSLVWVLVERPFLGFGWDQLNEAVYHAIDFPVTHGNTRHSHNLILDILLSNGLVLGSLIVSLCLAFAVKFIRNLQVGDPGYTIPFAALSILSVHAMLELPLYYAYFLLPFALLIGVLSRRAEIKICFSVGRWLATGIVTFLLVAVFITVRDYQEVERTFFFIYHGLKGNSVPPEELPNIYVLTQWQDRFVFANTPPSEKFSQLDYDKAQGVISATPSHFLLFVLAHNLALSNRSDEALFWLNKICNITARDLSQPLQERWQEISTGNEVYRRVVWPTCKN